MNNFEYDYIVIFEAKTFEYNSVMFNEQEYFKFCLEKDLNDFIDEINKCFNVKNVRYYKIKDDNFYK